MTPSVVQFMCLCVDLWGWGCWRLHICMRVSICLSVRNGWGCASIFAPFCVSCVWLRFGEVKGSKLLTTVLKFIYMGTYLSISGIRCIVKFSAELFPDRVNWYSVGNFCLWLLNQPSRWIYHSWVGIYYTFYRIREYIVYCLVFKYCENRMHW